MSCFRTIVRFLSAGALVFASCAAEAATSPRVNVQPQTRILQKIDKSAVTLLQHTTPAVIAAAVDKGRISPSTQFNHMMLVLKSSEAQEYALHTLLDAQQDKTTPNYHQWMTPDSFGASFGVASSDLAAITSWLQDAGMTVEAVTKGARIIEFSGTSGQVEAAFHTEMHSYVMNGEAHVSNSSDISIPTALAPVVVGVSSLNNFRPRADLVNPHKVVLGEDGKMYPAIAGTATPDYTSASSGNHYVGAEDLATIFDTNPMLKAGINGTGQTIGIIGQTDILLSDVQIYRSLFNLPKNDPTFTQIGGDPGTIGDDGESDLDVELSGGVAPGASINFVTSGNSYFGGGIDAAAVYLVENNNADILSLSYGECEANLGASGNAFFQVLWEQAASQGQTVFVSSGDSGPATCSSSGAPYAAGGYGVNGLGSTPYNVSVGGTMFNEGNATGTTPYWGPAAGAPYSTALSYIPEVPWNEGNGGTKTLGGLAAAGSGISLYYQTPAYQTGPGVPTTDPIVFANAAVAGPHRYMPDVSLVAAAAHDATIYCSEGSCKLNAAGAVAGIGAVGGTSVATPVMAGMQALINQKNGGRQGVANYYYYRLAAQQSQTACISSTLPSTAGGACMFHDVATGNTNVPSNAAGTTSIGFTAAPGYDLAVGLGSVDLSNVATAWSTVTFNATTTALTLTPTTGIAHGSTQNVTITVTPASGTGKPTGDVSILANAAYGGVGFYTLSNGSATGTLTGLPAGTYNVYAHYAGDLNYGGSNSAPVQVSISPEGSVLSVTPYLLATNGALSFTQTYTYGANVYLDAQVAGNSQTGTPTGKVTFTLKTGSTTLPPYAAPLDSFANAYYDAGLGFANYDIMPTAPVLAVGSYTVSASYSGDTTFNPTNMAPFGIVVGPANQALNLRAVSTEVQSGGTVTLNASIATVAQAAGGVAATGTVTFSEGANVLGTATLVNGSAVFTTTALTTNGAHTISATYSGDTNYLTQTAMTTVTVGGSASTLTLGVSATSVQVGTSVTLTATAPAGATGTVFFYDNGVSLGGATLATNNIASLVVTTFGARTHSITATYSGNTTIASSTSAATVITVAKNTPTLQLSSPQSINAGTTVSMNATLTPSPAGTKPNNPAPTGVIQFMDGTKVIGSATASYYPGYEVYVATFTSPALTPGVHSFSAQYVGDANYAAATSNVQTNNIGLTATTITSFPANVGTGIVFSLTAKVTEVVPVSPALTGSVSFFDGTTLLGTAPVMAGSATLTTAVLSGNATHMITAVYSGDANFATSTSPAVSIVTVTPAVTLSINGTSTTIPRGQPGGALLLFTVTGNYSGTAALSCTGLPANSTCTFGPPSLNLNGTNGTQTIPVIITTAAPKVVSGGASAAGLLWLPAMLLAGLLMVRRRQLPATARRLVALAVLICGLMAATGCGQSGGTPTGNDAVTITAVLTGSTPASPNLTLTTTLNVTIQ